MVLRQSKYTFFYFYFTPHFLLLRTVQEETFIITKLEILHLTITSKLEAALYTEEVSIVEYDSTINNTYLAGFLPCANN